MVNRKQNQQDQHSDDAVLREFRSARLGAANVMNYFRRGLFALVPIITDECPTAAVDKHARVYMNPGWFMRLSMGERQAIIVHEFLHVQLNHGERRGNRNPHKWNVACDLAINSMPIIKDLLPKNALFPETYNFPPGMTADWYFSQLPEDEEGEEEEGCDIPGNGGGSSSGKPGDNRGSGEGESEEEGGGEGDGESGDAQVASGNCGSGADGEERPWELGPPSEDEAALDESDWQTLRRDIAKDVQESSAKARGHLSGEMVQELTDILEPPKVNWRQLLASYVRCSATIHRGNEFRTYRMRSRNQDAVSKRVILPAKATKELNITIIWDTSGSMNTFREEVGAEVEGIIRQPKANVVVMSCDARVHSRQSVRSVSQVDLKGGGGTDMRVGIFEALAEKPAPDIVVVITDGYTPWPEKHAVGDAQIIACIVGGYDHTPEWLQSVSVED